MTSPRSLPVLEISGSPRERGRTYGEATRHQVAAALGYYSETVGNSHGLTWTQVTDLAGRWLVLVEEYAPDLVEEMRGIADGAGVGLLDVLALNARGEIIYDRSLKEGPPKTDGAAPIAKEPPDGCTSFAITGEASGDGHVYCGQNWDWREGVAETVLLLRIVQPGKPTVITQVEAGQLARQGANSAGVALNANGLGGRFDRSFGLPQTVIRRRVLESTTITRALDVLFDTRAHIASNALLTCREGLAVDIETTPGEHRWLYADRGLLVHGNHYQAGTPHQLAGHHRPLAADSLIRVPRAEAGLRQVTAADNPQQSRKIVHRTMSDHLGHPQSLCAHPDPQLPPLRRWMTLLSSCVDLTTGDYHVAPGPPCENAYQHAPWNLYDGPKGQ